MANEALIRYQVAGDADVMVWRIHFTPDDLERIQVSPTLGPLSETWMAVSLLRCPVLPRAVLSQWRGQVQDKVSPRMRPLTALIPPGGMGVDLCTLTGEAATIEQGLRALLDVPREHLLVEMGYTDRHGRLPAAAWALAEAGARPDLADAAQAAYEALVRPYWNRIRACLHAEQAARRRTLDREGADRLLASLQNQQIRWRPPVLEILRPGSDLDMHLSGHGISLVPSVFVGKDPSLLENPNDAADLPRLILPVADADHLWDLPRERGAALAALVGRTRAAVLAAIADGCSTTELASRAGISLAAASQHAAVLRGAGLIASRRQGGAMLHVLTPLGADLLAG